MARCCCGAPDPAPVAPGYGRCARCGTLVNLDSYDPERYLRATDDESAFYGRDYWQRRVPELHGLPSLEERARTDLSERSLFALEKILRFLEPGRPVLELGCSHGGLTYLMNRAGLAAEGLEMSPWLVSWARERFGVTVHLGPLEELELDHRFDAIVAIDVLEHLPDPLGTLRACREGLTPEGKLILQTPCYRGEGQEWAMFLPEEHLFLFTEDSVAHLLRKAGFVSSIVEPSLFPYDMWITATAQAALEARADPLAGQPPEILALLDQRHGSIELQEQVDELRADQAAKQGLIELIGAELEQIRADQRKKERRIAEDAIELQALRQAREAQEEQLRRAEKQLVEVREDQERKEELIQLQHAQIEAAGIERSARERLLGQQERQLALLEKEKLIHEESLRSFDAALREVREDQTAKEALIREISDRLEDERAKREAASSSSLRWRARHEQEERARVARDRELEALSSSYEDLLDTHGGRSPEKP